MNGAGAGFGVIALTGLLAAGTPVQAQVNCNGIGAQNCALATDQYPIFQTFNTLPNSAAGINLLNANLAAVNSIYLNATPAQRNQAAQNATTSGFTPQYNVWGMLSNLPASAFPLNASSFQAFPSVAASAGLATTAATQINNQSAPVYPQITRVLQGIVGIGGGSDYIAQIQAMKQSFTTYNAYYLQSQGLATSWATSGSLFPASSDLRPYQVSSTIGNAPWTLSQASSGSVSSQNEHWESNQTAQSFISEHSIDGNTTALLYALMLPQAYQSLMVSAQQFGLSRNILGLHYPLDIIGGRVISYYTMTQLLAGNPLYSSAFNNIMGGTVNFASYVQGLSTQLGAALGPAATAVPYAACAGNVASCLANGTFPSASQLTAANQAYASLSTYGLPSVLPASSTNVAPQNSNLLISLRFPYLSAAQQLDVLTSTMLPAGVPLDDGSGWARLNLYAAAGGYGAFNSGMVTVTMDAAQGGFNAIDFWGNNIGGSGGLTKMGSGTLVLGGNNTYTGGTIVGGGTLALSGTMIGNLGILPGATFVSSGGYAVQPGATLSNAGTFQSVNAALSNMGTLGNSGAMLTDLVNGGSVSNTGTITGTVSNGGAFANNGLVTGAFNNAGLLSGTGTIAGNLANSAVVAPGNTGIGTLSVAGNYVHAAAGSYQAEVTGTGQNDQISVGGAAALRGGTVYVYAVPGTVFAPTTRYRILSAAGGLTGSFAAVNELYPFLLSSLSYDANNAYLDLQIGGFAAAGQTPTQVAVGQVLDASAAGATGDFAAVLSSMAVNTLSVAQGQATLTALSGNNYAGFSSSMVQGAQLFMNNFANQSGGGGSPVSNRVALAEACDVACDGTQPPLWGAWGGALGGLGVIGANQPTGSVTYNVGGFAAGLDRLFTDTVRVGVTAGYTKGSQWIGGFDGKGTIDTFQAGLYGGYRQDKVYADALVGYAYSYNQMWRNIPIPGLQQRTAQGQTGANQFYGQVETGYRVDIGGAADAFVTPFARLQAYTANQNGFTETGAQSFNLSVAQQTTNSLRSVLGAQLGGALDLGWREKLALQFRLGWSHEYADTGRPVTAAFTGAPALSFTTYGVAPQRDGAVVGFSANTAVAEAVSLYLRYEGDISGQDSAHAITAGVRMTW